MKTSAISLLVFLLVGAACCAPVNSMLGADGTNLEEEWMPTAADYVQDGLVVALDSLENSGFGKYNQDAIEWVNLGFGGSLFNATISSGGFSDIGFVGTSTLTKPSCSGITVSIVIAQLPNTSSYQYNNALDAMDSTGGYQLYQHPLNGVHRFRWRIARNSTGALWQPFFISVDDGVPFSYSFRASSIGNKATYVNGKFHQQGSGSQGGYADGERQTMSLGHPNQSILRLAIYNRPLSDDEIAYNYLIDKMRFGL